MENIYIYTVYNDIIPGISKEDNESAKFEQNKRDKELFKIFKKENLHKFPINKQKLKDDIVKYVNISMQFNSLYMIFAAQNKAAVVNTGKLKIYSSIDEALKGCQNFNKNDNVRVIVSPYEENFT